MSSHDEDVYERMRMREESMRQLVQLTEAFAVNPKWHEHTSRDRGRKAAMAAIAAFEQLERFIETRD